MNILKFMVGEPKTQIKHRKNKMKTRKNKLLKQYGKGLAGSFIQEARDVHESSPRDTTVLGIIKCNIKNTLEEVAEKHSQKDSKKIMNYLAEGFIERGLPSLGYYSIKDVDKKRAELIKRNFGYTWILEDEDERR